jgi:hypothetical protein
MLEAYSFYVLLLSLALGIVGSIWLFVIACRERVLWGLASLLVLPAVIFVCSHWRKSRWPVRMLLLAGVLGAAPYGVNYYHEYFGTLGPREKLVEGERHITLTGWSGADYSFLQGKPDVVVLQMANPDVSDETLSYLRGMDRLRELDLNDTKVTDEGLAVLAEMPHLEELRLARTAITDAGFRKHLLGKESLRKLDLTGTTKVEGKTMREWKKEKAGREYLK